MLLGIKSAIVGSFVGDTMALGTHWVYDQEGIVSKYGRVETLLKPEMTEYHRGRDAGEFTHYGDQAYELLVEVSVDHEFDLNSFSSRFRALFKGDYDGYIDHATKQTLDLIGECTTYDTCASKSTDLGGASRMAPLLLAYGDDVFALKDSLEKFISYTHNDIRVKESGFFFGEVMNKIFTQSMKPTEAIRTIKDKFPHIKGMIDKGLESVDLDSSSAIKELGMACSVDGALASTIHIIAKYEDDFRTAIIENVMAGGDSAARGMLIGMVLGGYLGVDSIPTEWLDGMKKYSDIISLIEHKKHLHYYDEIVA